jgi:hypothetical protein
MVYDDDVFVSTRVEQNDRVEKNGGTEPDDANPGEKMGYAMLVAFAGDRDFDETLRLATALCQGMPGTRFHDYAIKLCTEIPKRLDDFKALTLPAPEATCLRHKPWSR